MERGIVALPELSRQRGLKEAMEKGMVSNLVKAWRCVVVILISPITVVPGLHALVLLISVVCVLLDCWSLDAALHNFALGFPGVTAIVALWVSSFSRFSWLVNNRYRFVAVTTGLLVGLILECLLLSSGIREFPIIDPQVGFYETWIFGGPMLVGCVNLVALITARNRLNQPAAPAPDQDQVIPSPHFPVLESPRPVKLEPYRPPVFTRLERVTTITYL
jgi:hypothetical protein